MTISIPDHVIVLDYGRVVSLEQSPADRARIEEIAGVGDAIWTAYRELRHPLDQGTLSADEFWRRIGASVGRDWDLATRHALWSADLRSWLTVDATTVQIVDELLAGGTRVVLLSNAGFDFASPYRHSPLGARLEHVFVSAEHDLLKPDARLYRHVAETVGVPTERLVMIDDRAENVRGVEALGGRGHVHTDAAALRAFLIALR
ncbi:HAD-IA family hydrolase [Schumannella sp. 10F1B-5-1]|uniref:HAD-IA family hydrolase n=1 Tax=Schumannella sp. 10F1B-5-1 TaxID=2590780 RepID=UPI0011312C09|nr:HAD-IA family hydrolase [Schumannella sp. 10F1B-5-1]TPW70636.1 HAD-IA family hydrolase [Schumannella sp. 10F1B-5-1]